MLSSYLFSSSFLCVNSFLWSSCIPCCLLLACLLEIALVIIFFPCYNLLCYHLLSCLSTAFIFFFRVCHSVFPLCYSFFFHFFFGISLIDRVFLHECQQSSCYGLPVHVNHFLVIISIMNRKFLGCQYSSCYGLFVCVNHFRVTGNCSQGGTESGDCF